MPSAFLNGHTMYYELHGEGPVVVVSGGWGTFCHGAERHLPRGLTDRYTVLIFDHRGIGESSDDPSQVASTALYADDVAALLAHLNVAHAHMVGIVGIGACIGQVLAIKHPGRVRTLFNSGTWAKADAHFSNQLEYWLLLHETVGFDTFQRAVVLCAFSPEFFNANAHRLLGPAGPWHDLKGNVATHARLSMAARGHNVQSELARIDVPSMVVHQGRDSVTPPHLSRAVQDGIPGALGYRFDDAAHVLTGRDNKMRFDELLLDFLAKH